MSPPEPEEREPLLRERCCRSAPEPLGAGAAGAPRAGAGRCGRAGWTPVLPHPCAHAGGTRRFGGRSRPGCWSALRRLRRPLRRWWWAPPAPAPAAGAAAPPSVATLMIGVPTGTTAPSCTRSSATVPAYGHGNSTSDFAVSISTTTSLTFTVSPGLTRHDTISASTKPSPTSGSLNSRTLTNPFANPSAGPWVSTPVPGRRPRAPGRGREGSPPPPGRRGRACRIPPPVARGPRVRRSIPA